MSETVDVNILLYATEASGRRYDAARSVVNRVYGGPAIAYLFWPTIVGFLRIATHPSVFDKPLSMPEATGKLEEILGRDHVQTPGEQDGFWRPFREVARDALPTGNLVSDAHLVALMRENGVRTIWSHDRDMGRFRDIEVRDPFTED